MEITKPLYREEINRNSIRTLILLRSNKPEAADLMLNMLNESILRRYGDSKQPIDVSKFSKLKPEKVDDNCTKALNKKPNLKNIKKGTNHQISKNKNKSNGLSNDVKIKARYQKTKNNSSKFNNKILRCDQSKTNVIKYEDNGSIRNKNKCFENYHLSLGEYNEGIKNNTSQALTKIKSLNNKEKSNKSFTLNGNNISNWLFNQEKKVHETQNTDNPNPKDKNKSLGMLPTVKRAQLQQNSAGRVRSHKKIPLHELSSRQRIQAILEKRINNK